MFCFIYKWICVMTTTLYDADAQLFTCFTDVDRDVCKITGQITGFAGIEQVDLCAPLCNMNSHYYLKFA